MKVSVNEKDDVVILELANSEVNTVYNSLGMNVRVIQMLLDTATPINESERNDLQDEVARANRMREQLNEALSDDSPNLTFVD